MTVHLTAREIATLRLYSEGFGPNATARYFGIAPSTARGMSARIRWKLDATHRAHAVAIALRSGVIV